MTKLADTLKKHKIDARRLVAVSKDLEGLRPEDRKIKLLKVQAKAGDEKAKAATAEKKEVRGGRTLAMPAINAAVNGEAVTGPTKTRILRAVNHVLTAKKQKEVTLKDIF